LTQESVAAVNRLQTVDGRVEVGLPYEVKAIPSDMLVKLAQHILKSAQADAEAKGVSNTTIVMGDGEPAARILACAKQENIDCIIMGSRGLSNIQALLEGSVSRKVSNRAACTTIAVR
jgi:nucleotide-binding universal stress UspA family protein